MSLCLSLSEDPRADGRLRVNINRARALHATEAAAAGDTATGKIVGLNGFKDVTMQLVAQLEGVSPWVLRRSTRVWFVAYEGEGGIDAGGLYRDLFTHVATELQIHKSSNALLLPCANSHGFGDYQVLGPIFRLFLFLLLLLLLLRLLLVLLFVLFLLLLLLPLLLLLLLLLWVWLLVLLLLFLLLFIMLLLLLLLLMLFSC